MESYQYAELFAKQKLMQMGECSPGYMLKCALSDIFIHLSVYQPEAFEQMLKQLRLKEVTECQL